MRKGFFIFLIFFYAFLLLKAQENDPHDFRWGNGFYYKMNVGEQIIFNNVKVKLLQINNHFNLIQVGTDTLLLKVARRSLPMKISGVRIFVADNRNVKKLTTDSLVHGLLNKDALICLSEISEPLFDPDRYVFPVSFNDGFLWSAEEDTYMFSWLGMDKSGESGRYRSYEGIGIDLHDARGIEKHWIVAIENSRVVWVDDKRNDPHGNEACILFESESHPGIYYVYNHLYNKNITVKEGRKIKKGELIGTVWGDETWGHLQFAVVKSDTVPDPKNCMKNVINGFPQFYSLYFGNALHHVSSFTKGRITFGKPRYLNSNKKNILGFEDYTGKGWKIGTWNIAERVEEVTKGDEGNIRLKKVLFEGTPAESENPDNYYDYEINVRSGTYRIRAKVGDLTLPSWQKVEFEGVKALTVSLDPGEFEWTTERIVKVEDGKLTVRIYIDEENKYVAGLSEIVFQRAY